MAELEEIRKQQLIFMLSDTFPHLVSDAIRYGVVSTEEGIVVLV